MAWSWSHSAEAYSNASARVHAMPRKTLEVIYAEWIAHRPDDGPEHFDQKAYAKALVEAGNLPDDTLADFVWEKAEELATCTNGGWEAYVCPFGCGPHTVPFSAPQAENELEAAQVS